MTKDKKRLIIILACAAAVIASVACAWVFVLRNAIFAPGTVNVEFVSVITGLDSGSINRFAGVVEPFETLEIRRDSSRALGQTYFGAGDLVSSGDIVFEYDTTELDLALKQLEVDISRLESSITSRKNQIDILEKQQNSVSTSQKLEYTTLIQSNEAQLAKDEYELELKELEADRIENEIRSSVVYSTINGVVQRVNQPGSTTDSGEDEPVYLVIISNEAYIIRGVVNEQNLRDLDLGARVSVFARSDGTVWRGEITHIDTENPIIGDLGADFSSYSNTGGVTLSTRYNFFVTADDAEGLLLGQHVYIEPEKTVTAREGIWLLEDYIVRAEDGIDPFVWAVNKKRDRIEKRSIQLGGYDNEERLFEIIGGLSEDDEIAWPAQDIIPGMAVARGSFAPGITETVQMESESPPDEENVYNDTDDAEEEHTIDPDAQPTDGTSYYFDPESTPITDPSSGSDLPPPSYGPSSNSDFNEVVKIPSTEKAVSEI